MGIIEPRNNGVAHSCKWMALQNVPVKSGSAFSWKLVIDQCSLEIVQFLRFGGCFFNGKNGFSMVNYFFWKTNDFPSLTTISYVG